MAGNDPAHGSLTTAALSRRAFLRSALIWTDNMSIPRGAEHPVDAITLMDFVYQPKIAAMIAAYVNHVTPVPAAKQGILTMADADGLSDQERATLQNVASSPLVFPTDADRERLRTYRELTNDDELARWEQEFGGFYS